MIEFLCCQNLSKSVIMSLCFSVHELRMYCLINVVIVNGCCLCVVLFVAQNRTISHSKGSHGVPGIFVKYDLSSLRVHIRESRQPFWQFLVRLCGIVGGMFATSGAPLCSVELHCESKTGPL